MTFFETITAAIRDMSERGYVSVEQLRSWLDLIRTSAEKEMISERELRSNLSASLLSEYNRLVENHGALHVHQGASKFTIDRLKPTLRLELDKRIVASAELIKLNREQAIDTTLRRFSGWATSIPVGGSKNVNRREEAKDIRKALASLPYRERFVAIDQGHKLNASINDIIARDGGAIGIVWRSKWRQKGYNYRHDHKERDEKFYLFRDSWAVQRGLVKPGPNGYYDDITKVGEEPGCGCYGKFIYHLRSVPEENLTVKGKAEMTAAREAVAAL